MCDNGLVTAVSDKTFVLTERVSQFVRSQTVPKTRYEEKETNNSVFTAAARQPVPRDVGNRDTAIAVRTDRSVVSSTKQTFTSMAVLGSEKDKYFAIMAQIIEFMKTQQMPVKAHVIAKGIKIGSSAKDVNRYVHCLHTNGVLEKIGEAEWKMNTQSDVSDADLDSYASVLAGKHSKTSKACQSKSLTEMDGGCPCPNRGPSCNHVHVTNNIQNNIYVGDTIANSDVIERPGT